MTMMLMIEMSVPDLMFVYMTSEAVACVSEWEKKAVKESRVYD